MSQPASWDQIEPDQIELRAGPLGDSPLAHALRRRLAELRRPGDPFATFSEHTDSEHTDGGGPPPRSCDQP